MARWLITAGGLGVVVMFAAIVWLIVRVALPLFGSASTTPMLDVPLPAAAASTTAPANHAPEGEPDVVAIGLDEDVVALWTLDREGAFSTFRLAGAELLDRQDISDMPLTAVAARRGSLAIGRSDGMVQVGSIGFSSSFIAESPYSLESLAEGQSAAWDGGIVQRVRGRLRYTQPRLEISEAQPVLDGETAAIRLLDYLQENGSQTIAAMLENGRIALVRVQSRPNMMTGEVTTRLVQFELPQSRTSPTDDLPIALLLGRGGSTLFVVYANGHLTRYDTRDPENAVIAEETSLSQDRGARLTSVRMLLGGVTLIAGDEQGRVEGWFAAAPPAGEQRPATTDGQRMVPAHELTSQETAITAIGTSSRDRQFATGDADGGVWLRHMTGESVQGRLEGTQGSRIVQVALAPKMNALVALGADRRLVVYGVENAHPDGSMAALFRPIHYEGRTGKEYVYQSSAASDEAEPKLSLIPLIFGTLKATVYAMLFAVPLAILAAIYSSEFMQPRLRSVVKPTVELMAGLPSVVLGFIAGLVLAPFVEDVVPAVLLTFIAVPTGVMIFGFLWQLLPPKMARSLPVWLPFVLMTLAVVAMVGLSFLLGPFIERLLFYGDIKAWLGGRVGTGRLGATPGWAALLTPLAAIGLVLVFNLYIRPRTALFDGKRRTRMQLAVADLVRFGVTAVMAVGVALAIGALLSLMGLDLRGSLVGRYEQRNALVVGVIMGFAIIPIIYTVSEDALSSVPNTLRSASLGAGATPWQTAVRVVLPVALSGIFSACMIGFGRAAGETMIVLMAAGNTPIMEWNLFDGLRTLSANIAVEMPEAPVGSTHYRVLYLSAVVLFAITFAVNTVAEVVRMRFRRRAYQL